MASRYKNFQPNPKKHKVGDCVLRAMCKAMEKDWDEVYRELCEVGFEVKAMPNDDKAWKEYLKRAGFTEHKIPVPKGSKRPTVQSFAESHEAGTYVLKVANHVVTCHEGRFYDIWDCGKKSLYGFWEKGLQRKPDMLE